MSRADNLAVSDKTVQEFVLDGEVSEAEVAAGAAQGRRWLSLRRLRFGFQASLAASGYIVFPSWLGGIVMQWGAVSVATDSLITVALPMSFANANLWQSATGTVNRISSGTSQPGVNVTVSTLSSITLANDDAAQIIKWFTFGF